MSKTVNLIYSSLQLKNPARPENTGFFCKIKLIRKIIFNFKAEGIINDFSPADEFEVGRGNSYAVFPELQAAVDKGQRVTLAMLRNGLKSRGIVNEFLQNKAMSLLLQNKAGIHYAMGNVLNGLLLENEHSFLMRRDYTVRFEVKNKNHIKLLFVGTWRDITKNPQEDCLEGRIEINITPEKIAINHFEITQLSNSPAAKNAFRFLEHNQVSLWQKIVIFFKTFFNAHSELDVENVNIDKKPWHENSRKHPVKL
jgi:hypothetical protein